MVLDTDPVLDTVEVTDGESEPLGLPEGETVGEEEKLSVAVDDSDDVMEADKQSVLLRVMVLDTDPVLDTVEDTDGEKEPLGLPEGETEEEEEKLSVAVDDSDDVMEVDKQSVLL